MISIYLVEQKHALLIVYSLIAYSFSDFVTIVFFCTGVVVLFVWAGTSQFTPLVLFFEHSLQMVVDKL